MQISQAREQYVDWLHNRELSPHTIRAYSGDVVAFERHVGGEARVTTIVSERIAEFIAAQRDAGLSRMSMRRRAAGVRGFCRYLVSRALLVTDPWVGTTLATATPRRLPLVLSRHDLDRLVRSPHAHGRGRRPGQRPSLASP